MATWESFDAFLTSASEMKSDQSRRQLVNELMHERNDWPWIEGNRATFVFFQPGVSKVAVNLDIIEGDPPFIPMTRLEGTDLWYAQHEFLLDDLLDYLIVVDDPMTPLRSDVNLLQRIQKHWQMDPLNSHRLRSAQMETSVLKMPGARPFPNWEAMPAVPDGLVTEQTFSSEVMGFSNRRLWVYTPPDYDRQSATPYPLLILFDGQWMVGPLQVPYIADALIKHRRLQPPVVAMLESGSQNERIKDFISSSDIYDALMNELIPFVQGEYRVAEGNFGVGGVGEGAIAAAYVALQNPSAFTKLMMLSPPLGRSKAQGRLLEYADRFDNADDVPNRIFQSVGRYEINTRFYKPGLALAGILQRRQANKGDTNHKFVELGSGHGLVAFRSVLPEALAHIFPGEAFGVG